MKDSHTETHGGQKSQLLFAAAGGARLPVGHARRGTKGRPLLYVGRR